MDPACASGQTADPVRLNRTPRRRNSRPGLFSRLHCWCKRRALRARIAGLDEYTRELRRHMELDRAEAARLPKSWNRQATLSARRTLDEAEMLRLHEERHSLIQQLEQLQ